VAPDATGAGSDIGPPHAGLSAPHAGLRTPARRRRSIAGGAAGYVAGSHSRRPSGVRTRSLAGSPVRVAADGRDRLPPRFRRLAGASRSATLGAPSARPRSRLAGRAGGGADPTQRPGPRLGSSGLRTLVRPEPASRRPGPGLLRPRDLDGPRLDAREWPAGVRPIPGGWLATPLPRRSAPGVGNGRPGHPRAPSAAAASRSGRPAGPGPAPVGAADRPARADRGGGDRRWRLLRPHPSDRHHRAQAQRLGSAHAHADFDTDPDTDPDPHADRGGQRDLHRSRS